MNAATTTTRFPVHTLDSAPEASRPHLRGLRASLGTIPNLAASMAESPSLLAGFLHLRRLFYEGSFTPTEVQILALTNAFENGCEYCMALHSALALQAGASAATVEELRRGQPPLEPRERALSDLSRRLVRERGHLRDEDLEAFLAAGYARHQALEVVLGVAVSILPNFAHHLTRCPLDDSFLPHAWQAAR
jgi:AhpD family alkylhydroperoxidase